MEQTNSVNEFLNKLSRYDIYNNVFYRGQLEEYNIITSSVSRDEGYTMNENFIYSESIKMKTVEFEELKLPIERLSKMQHYGIPTRLVDLTIDPLIALFFAVQNVNSNSHGNVYVFVQPECSLHDKRIKLLSLIATLDSLEIDLIKSSYYECYSESITEQEILEFASEGAFIKHSVELQKSNERLFCQKGTFAICGNEVIDSKIKKSVLPLNSIEPTMVIRIPFEHKQAVKRELDEKYDINETTVYPEFPSVAGYLKEKYRKIDFSIDGKYNILEVKDISNLSARRCSIVAVLNEVMHIEAVKQVGIEIINKYKDTNDVVWIYLAKNGDDYIMRNWMIRGQWIRTSLDPKFKPHLIGEIDDLGYIWHLEKSYSTLSDYYDECVFIDDKILFTQNMKTFEELESHYKFMLGAFESGHMESLEAYAFDKSGLITNLFLKFGDYGHSRNDEFNKYISNFQQLASHLDNVVLWTKKEDLNQNTKRYLVSNCFRDAKEHFDIIKDQEIYWRDAIGLSDEEYNEINLEKVEKREYQYTQTIPLNPNGLDVTFNLDITVNSDNTVNIRGITNLFDKASLMITLKNSNGLIMAQNKSFVENGKFDFGTLGKEKIGFNKGNYSVEISLSIPSVQNKEFLLKAGMEYENLQGKYVDRTGIGPTICYMKEFKV